MNRFTDRLGEAWLNAESAADALRAALKESNNVESIVVLQLIERAATLTRDIDQLREYAAADSK